MNDMTETGDDGWSRRDFLRAALGGGVGLVAGCSGRVEDTSGKEDGSPRPSAGDAGSTPSATADVTIRIAPVLVELAPHLVISTVGYNTTEASPHRSFACGRAGRSRWS